MATVTAAQWLNAAHTMLKATIDGVVWSGITATSPMWTDVQNSGVTIAAEAPPRIDARIHLYRMRARRLAREGNHLGAILMLKRIGE